MRLSGYPREWLVLALIAFGTLPLVSITGAQDSSRLAVSDSILLRGEVNIDPYWRLTIDRAFAGGHWYSDKAPGIAPARAPHGRGRAPRRRRDWSRASSGRHQIWLSRWPLWA